jgi:surfeit locus 1 family protein
MADSRGQKGLTDKLPANSHPPLAIALLFSRQWWWTTLLVVAAMAVMARLGLWQLDRLVGRRAFNARVSAQLAAPPLTLNPDSLAVDLTGMEYRSVVVTGAYDFAPQVALRNQIWDEGRAAVRAGVHLLTPLVVEGAGRAVLVDRGWIPLAESAPENWGRFDEPGRVTVRGVIRRSQSRADFGSVTDPAGHLLEWNLVNLPRIAAQMPYDLLPVYIQQAPDNSALPVGEAAGSSLPYRSRPQLDLSEGSHLGYALQWFSFAIVLGIGYPFFVRQSARPQVRAGKAGWDEAAARPVLRNEYDS